jgi:adenylate cyclase
LIASIVYLFVEAPPPLSGAQIQGKTIPVSVMLEIVNNENRLVRELYTKEIVTQGQKVGLVFDENWRDQGVDAGPLPALFLRATASSLEKDPVRLALFLGSDYPINTANRFSGQQVDIYNQLKKTMKPQFFYQDDTELYTAMFPDLAVAPGCITCHNRHVQTPKKDWKLNDIMGATTWTYPSEYVTYDELLQVLAALRKGFREAYEEYLTKVGSFRRKPKIGEKWPSNGYFLPSSAEFLFEIERRSSSQTLGKLLTAVQHTTSEQKTR